MLIKLWKRKQKNKKQTNHKPLDMALNPIFTGGQPEKFERIKVMYSCIIQKVGSTEQLQEAQKIIEKFENDISYRKSMIKNHIKYLF